MNNEYLVIGLMSGTSLDGLDIALCRFQKKENWSFEITEGVTVEYDAAWKTKLAQAHLMSGIELSTLHVELGILHGNLTNSFIRNKKIVPDFIASHGHTVFHQPENRLTLQIGSAPHIAAQTGHTVVADFRTTDVALGGQGAPLVPIGDLLLFSEYDFCLNLGGIANISHKKEKTITAFDVCPCNMVLNFLAQKKGREFDENGAMAAEGKIIPALLDDLNQLVFYAQHAPKSLGKEFFDAEIFPLINAYPEVTEDVLRTVVEHIAIQISNVVLQHANKSMLITGGGAFNAFLISRLRALSNINIVIPDKKIIQFKEALIFAFLGVLRMREEVNCLASVTGASKNSTGGAIYLS